MFHRRDGNTDGRCRQRDFKWRGHVEMGCMWLEKGVYNNVTVIIPLSVHGKDRFGTSADRELSIQEYGTDWS